MIQYTKNFFTRKKSPKSPNKQKVEWYEIFGIYLSHLDNRVNSWDEYQIESLPVASHSRSGKSYTESDWVKELNEHLDWERSDDVMSMKLIKHAIAKSDSDRVRIQTSFLKEVDDLNRLHKLGKYGTKSDSDRAKYGLNK